MQSVSSRFVVNCGSQQISNSRWILKGLSTTPKSNLALFLPQRSTPNTRPILVLSCKFTGQVQSHSLKLTPTVTHTRRYFSQHNHKNHKNHKNAPNSTDLTKQHSTPPNKSTTTTSTTSTTSASSANPTTSTTPKTTSKTPPPIEQNITQKASSTEPPTNITTPDGLSPTTLKNDPEPVVLREKKVFVWFSYSNLTLPRMGTKAELTDLFKHVFEFWPQWRSFPNRRVAKTTELEWSALQKNLSEKNVAEKNKNNLKKNNVNNNIKKIIIPMEKNGESVTPLTSALLQSHQPVQATETSVVTKIKEAVTQIGQNVQKMAQNVQDGPNVVPNAPSGPQITQTTQKTLQTVPYLDRISQSEFLQYEQEFRSFNDGQLKLKIMALVDEMNYYNDRFLIGKWISDNQAVTRDQIRLFYSQLKASHPTTPAALQMYGSNINSYVELNSKVMGFRERFDVKAINAELVNLVDLLKLKKITLQPFNKADIAPFNQAVAAFKQQSGPVAGAKVSGEGKAIIGNYRIDEEKMAERMVPKVTNPFTKQPTAATTTKESSRKNVHFVDQNNTSKAPKVTVEGQSDGSIVTKADFRAPDPSAHVQFASSAHITHSSTPRSITTTVKTDLKTGKAQTQRSVTLLSPTLRRSILVFSLQGLLFDLDLAPLRLRWSIASKWVLKKFNYTQDELDSMVLAQWTPGGRSYRRDHANKYAGYQYSSDYEGDEDDNHGKNDKKDKSEQNGTKSTTASFDTAQGLPTYLFDNATIAMAKVDQSQYALSSGSYLQQQQNLTKGGKNDGTTPDYLKDYV